MNPQHGRKKKSQKKAGHPATAQKKKKGERECQPNVGPAKRWKEKVTQGGHPPLLVIKGKRERTSHRLDEREGRPRKRPLRIPFGQKKKRKTFFPRKKRHKFEATRDSIRAWKRETLGSHEKKAEVVGGGPTIHDSLDGGKKKRGRKYPSAFEIRRGSRSTEHMPPVPQ